jgi:Uma2 family endonuclease
MSKMLGDSTTKDSDLAFGTTPPWPLRRFSVEQYQRLGALGILTPEDRVELLEGWIVEKMNHGPMHGYIVRMLADWLHSHLPPGFIVQCQLPLTTERSEPEPDLSIIRGVHKDFRNRHPSGRECRLVIEVADTSVDRDRAKAAIYRSAGVEEYWIINISERSIERYQFAEGLQSDQPAILPANSRITLDISDAVMVLDLATLWNAE